MLELLATAADARAITADLRAVAPERFRHEGLDYAHFTRRVREEWQLDLRASSRK